MKSVIVTGASSGIGRVTAELFLACGWRVGLLARREQALREVAGDHPAAHLLPADVTDEAGVERAFAQFLKAAGRIDVLFNNAGIFAQAGLIDEIPLEAWQRSIDVNLTGMFLCARAAFSAMRRQHPQGGRIINNGSIAAHVPRPRSVHYSATKHAITGLTRSLSLDGRDFGIACGQIDIGNARTEMVSGLVEAQQAEGRMPDPTMAVEDAARSVLHMAELPPEANVQFMTVMATTMPYIGRG
ncbi:NADP-dependent 3-hydroxy acid dehydrogenase YdfG [Cribrihabitans marinus]|uniref:NADP-dependent 3-hydroxy acid dehydrogenase YdfG n=1 Tax=Cribrihabitans marinus TaxID=1227549 RepID=A0A1H7CK01_9RHOB|nr:SDR family oxidoreductase [Cribrihabitans marinus]GGH35512.1 oxidoreductase [Cribrihabitans marinus]SEJ88907.1 NADP-dependent 3-hydroxy acid dehydrogenase YdfG [Cribrihabitans marinus]